jgi:hypothetical protein
LINFIKNGKLRRSFCEEKMPNQSWFVKRWEVPASGFDVTPESGGQGRIVPFFSQALLPPTLAFLYLCSNPTQGPEYVLKFNPQNIVPAPTTCYTIRDGRILRINDIDEKIQQIIDEGTYLLFLEEGRWKLAKPRLQRLP